MIAERRGYRSIMVVLTIEPSLVPIGHCDPTSAGEDFIVLVFSAGSSLKQLRD